MPCWIVTTTAPHQLSVLEARCQRASAESSGSGSAPHVSRRYCAFASGGLDHRSATSGGHGSSACSRTQETQCSGLRKLSNYGGQWRAYGFLLRPALPGTGLRDDSVNPQLLTVSHALALRTVSCALGLPR